MERIIALVTIFILSMHAIIAQESKNYYVTIGVFSKVSNAERLTKKAIEQGYSAQHTVYPIRKINYVYALVTNDKRKAYALAVKLRAETEYKDAWVFDGDLGETPTVAAVIEPIAEIKEEPVIEVKPLEPEIKVKIDSSKFVKPIEKPIEPVVEKKPVGKPFYFKLRNVADNTEVMSGEVHVQEAVRATQYQAFKPGELVYLEAPKNKRGSYTVVTQVPGYSPLSVVFNYENPAGEKGASNEVIIELPVTKAKKGDYVDFNNVKFFKNSSILQPGSQNELDGLVDLMKENIKFKVKIHGHVNGIQNRECFVRGANSGFFATNPSADKTERNLSSKDLSILRAETVKDYLLSQGIDASRLSTKGEGGKIPLYPEGGSLGPLNDRIEIEFTKTKT